MPSFRSFLDSHSQAPSTQHVDELERAAYLAYRVEMAERRRTPRDPEALMWAKDNRKEAEYRASLRAMTDA